MIDFVHSQLTYNTAKKPKFLKGIKSYTCFNIVIMLHHNLCITDSPIPSSPSIASTDAVSANTAKTKETIILAIFVKQALSSFEEPIV